MIGEWVIAVPFVEWLEENGFQRGEAQLTESQNRSINRWSAGEAKAASIATVEPILERLDLEVWEMPDDLRIEAPNRHRRMTSEEIEEVVARYPEENPVEIAKAMGFSPRAVRHQLGKAGLA